MDIILAQGTGFNVLDSLQSGFTQLVGYLPQLIGALLVLVIGYLIARILRAVVTRVLRKLRLDDRMSRSGQGARYVESLSPQGSPARLIGTVVFAVVMLFVLSSAIGTLGIPALTGFMNAVLGYLPRVLAALAIFLLAAAVAGAVGTLVDRTMGDTPVGRMARTAAPTLVMAIGVFMILTQLRIAPVIVTVTYVALVGAIALGSAIAFGLGGREAAADMINSSYRQTVRGGQHASAGPEATGTEESGQSWTMRGAGSTTPEPQGAPEGEQRWSSGGAEGSGGSTGESGGGSYRAT
ncbi:mechanosensitive ion channel family protein [Actinopolyspora saharensis]|uniref:mechanosensitive ion channel family protein n=1 Tax=Actinopolyspora saharensis TaxID=995062 RepID=UPI003F66F6DB